MRRRSVDLPHHPGRRRSDATPSGDHGRHPDSDGTAADDTSATSSRHLDHPFSVTVEPGWRRAVAEVTNRPVIALRERDPEPLLGPVSMTVLFG